MVGGSRVSVTSLQGGVEGVWRSVLLSWVEERRLTCVSHLVGVIASVCGYYCSPTLPIYTAAKHGVVGFVRSYGKYLPSEKIALNAVTPNVVRTNISTPQFYDSLEEKGLLTPLEGVVEAFESLLGKGDTSGECIEVGPNYAKGQGLVKPKFVEYVDKESYDVFQLLEARGRPLQLPG